MKKTFNLKGYALASIAVAVLAACGGGGGSSTPAAAGAAGVLPVAFVAPPAATPGVTPADASVAGTLPTLAFVSAQTSSTVNATITGSGTTSDMTFPSFTVTGASGNGPSWSPGGGMAKAGGNVLLYCANGKTTPSGSNQTDLSFQMGGKAFISANMVAVTDTSVLAGITLKTEDCAGNTVTTTYNADGTALRVQTGFSDFTMTAAQASAFASDDGWTGSNGGNYKSRFYKYTSGATAVTAATVRYFVVTLINQKGPDGLYLNVGYQP